MTVRTRIAPSPTGEDIHIGNLYTALINWTVAKKNQGKFIIRIEDTDRERLIEGSEQKILSTIKAYGLAYDEGPDIKGPFAPYRQSERLKLYKQYAEELIEKESAYYCFCSKEKLEELRNKNEGKANKKHLEYCDFNLDESKKRITTGEKYVIRLKVPQNKDIIFEDLIRGEITINSDQIDDQILIKSDGFPTYHMAVVVDDHLMEITHVIRAEEWISSTPKHVLLYQALGWSLPIFAHLPLLRNTDRSKLSKRHNPVWASWYLKEGFLPEAMLNYLALMGWSHPEAKEIFTLDEFVEKFELKDVLPVGPVFNITKLEWMNGEYIRKMSGEELTKRLEDFLVDHPSKDKIAPLTPLVKERIKKLSDFIPLVDFLFSKPDYEKSIFEKVAGDKKNLLKDILSDILSTLEKASRPWDAKEFEQSFRDLADKLGLSTTQIFQLIRVAISGKTVTPPLFESIKILGEEETLNRVKTANNLF